MCAQQADGALEQRPKKTAMWKRVLLQVGLVIVLAVLVCRVLGATGSSSARVGGTG